MCFYFRRYFNNSVLQMHVDRVGTHIISGIINIAQNVEEDWKLLILDHDGNEHRLAMKPGDLLLYESARLIHGRPGQLRDALSLLEVVFLKLSVFFETEPMKGQYYDNLFIHYTPTNWGYGWLNP